MRRVAVQTLGPCAALTGLVSCVSRLVEQYGFFVPGNTCDRVAFPSPGSIGISPLGRDKVAPLPSAAMLPVWLMATRGPFLARMGFKVCCCGQQLVAALGMSSSNSANLNQRLQQVHLAAAR